MRLSLSLSLSLSLCCVSHTGIACFYLRGPFFFFTCNTRVLLSLRCRFPSPSPSSLHLSVKKGRKWKREVSVRRNDEKAAREREKEGVKEESRTEESGLAET